MQPEPHPPAASPRGLRAVAILTLAVAAGVVAFGVLTRQTADADLRHWTEEQAAPVVAVAPPGGRAERASIDLPGRLEAYSQAQIYARTSGYLRTWKADIGTPVKAGDTLAEIDAPDLDQQITQAEAALTSAQANATLSRATLERGQTLIKTGAVSKQDLDQRAADSGNKQGLVKSSQANLDRLKVLEQYKRLTAPFDGIVTARSTDVGALINAGSSASAPLFVVSDIRKLRLYVNVPQVYMPAIRPGMTARLTVPEYPGRSFEAKVEANARAVDVGSGTTRVQLAVDNSHGELMTGAFANVQIDLPRPGTAISVPATALIFDQSGLRVATVGAGNKVALKPVKVSRDLGKVVELASGLSPDDRVVQSPSDGIADGDTVRIAKDADSPGGAEGPNTAAAAQTKPPG